MYFIREHSEMLKQTDNESSAVVYMLTIPHLINETCLLPPLSVVRTCTEHTAHACICATFHLTATFDVQDLLVSVCPGGGGINVSIVYVEGTLSPGALVCVLSLKNEASRLDFANMKLFAIPRHMSDNFTIPVSSGEYRVAALDLETNTLPRLPVSMISNAKNVTVISDNEGIVLIYW